MSVSKRPLAALIVLVGLIAAAFVSSTTSASAYPPGTAPTLSAGASTVGPGGSLTVSGSHFHGTVTITASAAVEADNDDGVQSFAGQLLARRFSGPVILGTTTAAADGTFSKRVTLSEDQFPPGDYTITATDEVGDSTSLSVTVAAAAQSSDSNSSDSNSSDSNSSDSNGGSSNGDSSNGDSSNAGGNSLASTGVAVASIGGLGVLLLLGGGLMLVAGRRHRATV